MKDHSTIDRRSLAFDQLTAQKVAANPVLIEKAVRNISRWLETCSPQIRPALLEWQEVLQGPREELLALLVSTEERAMRLRQSSPFAGVLSRAERSAIIMRFRDHDTAAT